MACHANIRYRHMCLFCVPVSWCASVYNEDDVAGESWYTEKVCLYRDYACNECACNEKLLYWIAHGRSSGTVTRCFEPKISLFKIQV